MNEASSTTYLVVGAGGSHGATGNHVARQLLARGLPTRAFVHHDDDRSAALKQLGAQVVVGDLGDFGTVRAALDGVRRAYFTYPLADSLLTATTTFAAAGKQAGVESIVNMSQLTARPDHTSAAARGHWLAERVFDWSGIGVSHLRPPYFLENLLTIANPAAIRTGAIYLPYGAGRHAPVAGEDVARVAVGLLTNPAPPHGEILSPTGPVALSMAEQAEVFSRVLGRPIRYVEVPVETWRQALSRTGGIPDYLIEHLCHVAETHRHGEQDVVTDVVEAIGGAPPQSLETFLHHHRAAFDHPAPATRKPRSETGLDLREC
ncbi:NmrA family NAD(P)-binding protein [Actinocatenispora sera]|uniref:NmrA family NAD(P)-binding protein n=1 Tax=Actinocatenispora sera TaxID=390989 RepID=UPI00340F9F40